MKAILLLTLLICGACGRVTHMGDPIPLAAEPQPTPVSAPQCAVIDTCTYAGGFNSQPMYDCRSTVYQASDRPDLMPLMNGASCLTTREDWQLRSGNCEVSPGIFMPCTREFQGPGEPAL